MYKALQYCHFKRHTYSYNCNREKPGEAHVEELLDGDNGSAAAVHGVLSATSDTSACVSCACSMLWTVVSTRTAGLAMGKAGAATIEGRPPLEPPPPPRRRVSDRETPFCRRRRHPSQQHASKHSNTTPAARLPASQRTPASIQASPLDTLLPSLSPDGGDGGGGGGSRLAAATLSVTCSLTSTVNCFGSGGGGEEGDGSKGRGGGGRNVGLDSGGGEGEGGHGGGDTVTENMVFSIQSMYRETRVYTPGIGIGCCEFSTAAQP